MGYWSVLIQTAVVVGLMAVWGIWEYREREIRHRKTILDLRSGVETKSRPGPNWAKVTTTSVVAFLLLAVIAGAAISAGNIGLHYAGPLLLWVLELALVAVILSMMAVRDAKKLREG